MATHRVVLRFPQQLIDQPIISSTIKTYDLDFNILRAEITPASEGLMVIELSGQDKPLNDAIRHLKKSGVKVEPIGRDVVRNEDRCTECGACVTICPTEALAIDLESRHVHFDSEKCIACELCVPVCPSRAMELTF